jgi:hypothetical protein
MYVGAGYLGGSWIFLRAIFERRWHRVAPGFLPVTTFATSMLLLTILYWGFFDLGHLPFQIWLFLYIVTPVLVPWVWLNNRRADPGTPEPGDVFVPLPVCWVMCALGAALLVLAVVGFVSPATLIRIWPWTLAPLGAHVIGGWLALLGVGGLVIGRERRWSSWRIGLESIAIWHLLVLIAAALNPGDFAGGTLLNWYIVGAVIIVAGMAALYAWMEARRWLASRRGAVSSPAM